MDPTLYQAAMKGDINGLIRYKDHFETLLTPKDNTVLHIAAMHGKTKVVDKILRICPFLLGRVNSQGETPVDTILRICPSLLGRVNSQGETPLHITARAGHTGVVQALFDFVDRQNNNIEIVREMLGGKNVDGDTAFHMAVRNGHLDVVKLLLEKDSTISYLPNLEEETPLYLAGKKGFHKIISEILKTYTSPLYGGPNGRTVLHAAVIFGSRECTTKLLNWRGSLAKEADVDGWTPLHIAASQGHVNVIEVLLSSCPDCWEIDNIKGQNILHIAVENNKYNVVEYIKKNSFLSGLINQKDNARNTCHSQLLAAPADVLDTEMIDAPNKLRRADVSRDSGSRNSVSNLSDSQNDSIEALRKMADSHMIVAALVATVTFAAGLTLPGGYYGNDGPNPGMAILSRTKAFKGFMVFNTAALVLSVMAILCFFDAARRNDKAMLKKMYRICRLAVAEALMAMMIAFSSGTRAVSAKSLDLTLAECMLWLAVVFICLFYHLYLRDVIAEDFSWVIELIYWCR